VVHHRPLVGLKTRSPEWAYCKSRTRRPGSGAEKQICQLQPLVAPQLMHL